MNHHLSSPLKGGNPAAPSGTATLLRLRPSYQSYLKQLPPEGWNTALGYYRLPWRDGRCVQDPGTYSPLHADERLLAIPTSCSRVADYNPNLGKFFGISSALRVGNPLYFPLYYVCSPERKGHTDLTSAPPSSWLAQAVSLESPPLRAGN